MIKDFSRMIAVALALLVSPIAGAQQQLRPGTPPLIEPDLRGMRPQPGERMTDGEVFRLLDIDHQETLSRSEWRERAMAIFYLLDTNTDIYLEPNEVPGTSEVTFAAADTDHDGRLSGFEFNQASFAQFESADLDRDGTVTFGEFERFRTDIAGP
jgi:EF hand domain-containing protein